MVGLIEEDNEKMDLSLDEGKDLNKTGKKYKIGNNNLSMRRDNLEIVNMFDKEGLIDNWEVLEKIWEFSFNETLRLETKEHPILFSEPLHNSNKHRERLAEIAFERFNVPGFFLSKSPVLNCFMSGKSSGLSIEFSHKYTS